MEPLPPPGTPSKVPSSTEGNDLATLQPALHIWVWLTPNDGTMQPSLSRERLAIGRKERKLKLKKIIWIVGRKKRKKQGKKRGYEGFQRRER